MAIFVTLRKCTGEIKMAKDEKEKKQIWIIRFEDKSLMSYYGTKVEAEAAAKSLRALRGEYIIA